MAKVENIIRDGNWSWPSANSMELLKVKRDIDFRLNGEEKWNATFDGVFLIHSTWELLRSKSKRLVGIISSSLSIISPSML